MRTEGRKREIRQQQQGLRGAGSSLTSCRGAIIARVFIHVEILAERMMAFIAPPPSPRLTCGNYSRRCSVPKVCLAIGEEKKKKKAPFYRRLQISSCCSEAWRRNTETNPRKLWCSSVHPALLALVNNIAAKFPSCNFEFIPGVIKARMLSAWTKLPLV